MKKRWRPHEGYRGTVADRFWEKTKKFGRNECWLWIGAKDRKGYGQLYIRGKLRPAHRVSWELAKRKKFPKGFNACHKCNEPSCVNPKHVYPATQSENILYAVMNGRHFTPFKKRRRKCHGMAS